MLEHHKKYLAERGINSLDITNHNITYYNTKENNLQFSYNLTGLCFPYFNFYKEIINYRLRPFDDDFDKNSQAKEYYLEKDGKLPKFLSQKDSANYAYFSPLLDWSKISNKTKEDIIITEGETRAILLAKYNINCIALGGVWNFTNTTKSGSKVFLPALEEIDWGGRNVGLCFDSDIVHKKSVKLALESLICYLHERGANCYVILLPTEATGDKNGLDDFVVRHGIDAFKQLDKQFKIFQQNTKGFLTYEKETGLQLQISEPIVSIKGLMAWTALKERWRYRKDFGWYYWNNLNWEAATEDNLLSEIQSFREANAWLKCNEDEQILKEIQKKESNFTKSYKWNNPDWLGFKNGYLNVKTKEFCLPFRDANLINILPFDYDSEAQCPNWLNFLKFTFNDNQKIQYVKSWFRWILSPKDNNEKFDLEGTLWLVGEPGYGKGTLLGVLKDLIGSTNYGVLEPENIADPNALFSLIDKKLAINEDATGFIKNIGLLNRICSNEDVKVHHLYQNKFDCRLGCVPVFAMNKPLSFSSSGSEGLNRRLHILKFNKKPVKPDYQLKKKLKAELNGIFNWCMSVNYDDAIKAIAKFKDQSHFEEIYTTSHPEYQFLQEMHETGGEIQASTLYKEYREWLENNGLSDRSKNSFAEGLKSLHIHKKKTANFIVYELPNLTYISLDDLLNDRLNLDDLEEVLEMYQDDTKDAHLEGKTTISKSQNPSCEPIVQTMHTLNTEKNSSNPSPEPIVQTMQTLEQNFSEKKNNLEISKKVSPPSVHSLHDPNISTLSTPTLTDSIYQLHKLINNELTRLNWYFNRSNQECIQRYQKEFNSLTLEQKQDYLKYLQLKKDGLEISKPPIKEKPPDFNISDCLPYLEQGQGKHKRNYKCPSCQKDYLVIKPDKYFFCCNPESNHCDPKTLTKDYLIPLLKAHDPKWQNLK